MKPAEKKLLPKESADRIQGRLERLYGAGSVPGLVRRLRMMLGRYGIGLERREAHLPEEKSRWSERDTVLITYADSISRDEEPPLKTLHHFLNEHARGAIGTVHLLPFCPWSSDDGFSVIDYREVAPEYGSWIDVENIGEDFRLMFDLVLNHCSRRSQWFRDYVTGIAPARYYFLPIDPKAHREELKKVVRPRSLPLLSRTATRDGEAWVWTTFSDDQVDLNWANPEVLFEFLDILFLYLSKGVDILRLDAVAFLWKEIGTDCLHRPETHEVVKLFRDVLDLVAPDLNLLTETNVPHEENMSYFGDGDEAHMIYNFTLPPLMLHGFLRHDASQLTAWAKTLPELPADQAFFNFTASHDGIGVRPLQGIVDDSERDWLVGEIERRGGRVSKRAMPDGSETPYELNITYRDALADLENPDLGITRFLCSQALLLAFRGVPAIYIHSLLGTSNDEAGVAELGHNRAINRRKYRLEELQEALSDPESSQSLIFAKILTWLRRRNDHAAFHPQGAMEIIDLGPELFAFLRISPDGGEKIACVFNFTPEPQKIRMAHLHPDLGKAGECRELLSGDSLPTGPRRTFTLAPFFAYWLKIT